MWCIFKIFSKTELRKISEKLKYRIAILTLQSRCFDIQYRGGGGRVKSATARDRDKRTFSTKFLSPTLLTQSEEIISQYFYCI